MIDQDDKMAAAATLRPMTLGEILDRTFHIYRRRFLLLLPVSVIPAAIMLAFHLADQLWIHSTSRIRQASMTDSGRIVMGMLVWLAFYHISSLVDLPFSAALVKQVSGTVLNEACSVRESLGFLRKRWNSYLWISALKVTGTLIVPEALAAGVFTGMGFSLDAAGLLTSDKSVAFVILMIVPALLGIGLFLWLGACLSLAIPAGALESMKGTRALRRSWILTRGSRWRILTLWVLMLIFFMVFSWTLLTLLRWGLFYSVWPFHAHLSAQFLQSVVQAAGAAIHAVLVPLYPIAITLIYYDQRIRKEGFDIEMMMDRAGMNANAIAVSAGPGKPEEQSA